MVKTGTKFTKRFTADFWLLLIGTILIVVWANWQVATGVLLTVWSHNLEYHD